MSHVINPIDRCRILSGAYAPAMRIKPRVYVAARDDARLRAAMALYDIRPHPDGGYWPQWARGPRAERDAIIRLYRVRCSMPESGWHHGAMCVMDAAFTTARSSTPSQLWGAP